MDVKTEKMDFIDAVVKEEYEIEEMPEEAESREWETWDANALPAEAIKAEPEEPEDVKNVMLLDTKPQGLDCVSDLEQNGTHQCGICGRSFKNRYTLKSHMVKHQKKKGFPCPYCTRVILQKKRLMHHLKTNHECSVCGAMFRMNIERTTHMQQVHYASSSSAKADSKQPVELKKFYPCHGCGRVFIYEKTMRTHLLMECKADPLTCSICAQTFTKTVTLTNHVRTEHTVSKALPNCKLCAMSFISDGHFERHMRTHKENYNCPLCSKEFSYKFQIESHMRKFHSSKRTKVELPQKTFKTEISNEKSMKKFEAKDYIIKTEAMLKTEVESKEKNDKFECPHCSKKYVNANIFLKHLSTHTEYNAENVQCSICSRKFHSKTSLRRHRSRFCMASSYICPICKTCSSTPNDFFEHLRDHDINVNKPTSVQKIQPSELQQDIEIKIEPPESETVENFKSELENL